MLSLHHLIGDKVSAIATEAPVEVHSLRARGLCTSSGASVVLHEEHIVLTPEAFVSRRH